MAMLEIPAVINAAPACMRHAVSELQRAGDGLNGDGTSYSQATDEDAAAVAEVEYTGRDPAAIRQLVHVAAHAG